MIGVELDKILFVDIETVGAEKDWDTLVKNKPDLAYQFETYLDWFQKRFPEDADKDVSEIFVNRSALVPEFGKIVCISFGSVNEDGTHKLGSFYGHDEYDILRKTQKVLVGANKRNMYLCGHNVKGFDIPYMAKRMIINGIMPPALLPGHDVKPWEKRAIDTKELWQYGNYGQLASLELMCLMLGVDNPKTSEVTGNKVHNAFWIDNNIDGIVKYCEKDVDVLIDVMEKLLNLKPL